MRVIVKACLNGDRSRPDHPAVPITSAELAEAAYGAVVRILVEAIPGVSPGSDGVEAARAVLAELPTVQDEVDRLVHGENEWAWPVLSWAGAHGYSIRAGLEDMLVLPDGTPAQANAELIRTARNWRRPR